MLVCDRWDRQNEISHGNSSRYLDPERWSAAQLAIHTIDVAIVLIYLMLVVAFGSWIGRGSTNLSGYLLGGRDLPWWAVLGSIVATETSTATFLSVPGIAFAKGGDFRFLQLALGYVLGRAVVSAVLLPAYFRGQLFSAYEVLEHRFGNATKRAASLMFLVARNLGDGLRLFLTGIVLEQVAGIALPVCILIVGAVTIAYTFFGGMKAIVWNDCAQFVVYVAGGVLAGALIIQAIPDGWGGFSAFAQEHQKLRVFDFDWHPTTTYTFWSGLIGGAVLTMGTHGTDQMMVQRYLAARTRQDASRALVLSGLVVTLQFALFLLLGVALAAFYFHHPPARPFTRNDEVFATYIVTELPVGIVGITLAAVFSAAMSTLSSSLHSSAAVAVNDFYLPMRKALSRTDRGLFASRLFTILFGVVQIVVGIAASHFSRSVVGDALAIAGFTAGVLLGMFALGVLTKRVQQTAALLGMACGLAMLTVIKFATPIAWPWYAVIGAVATFSSGWLCSLVWPGRGRPDSPFAIPLPREEPDAA